MDTFENPAHPLDPTEAKRLLALRVKAGAFTVLLSASAAQGMLAPAAAAEASSASIDDRIEAVRDTLSSPAAPALRADDPAQPWGNGWINWGNGWNNWRNGWNNWHNWDNGWNNWHNWRNAWGNHP